MTNLSLAGSAEYPQHLLDRVAARIAPYFDDGSGVCAEADYRAAALECMLSLDPVTGEELRLVAQVCAFTAASLDCLRCSMLLPNEQLETILRMREDALKLNAMSMKAQRVLDARQGARRRGQACRPENKVFNEVEFNAVMNKAREMVTFARAKGEAVRVVQALDAAVPPGSAITPRRKAAEAWANDLQNPAAWPQQTRH